MAINSLDVQDFTVFSKTKIEFCDGVNVFIGENGTGKTHLLKILYAFCKCKHDPSKFKDTFSNSFFISLEDCFYNGSMADGLIRRNIPAQCTASSLIVEIESASANLKYIYPVRKGDLSYPGEEYSCKKEIISSVFIPSKDMLTHGRLEKDFAQRNLPFDDTLIDILNKAGVSTLKELDEASGRLLKKISNVIGGKVIYKNDRYYIEKERIGCVEFAVEAEGFKKFGLIYRLIETGYLKNNSILIWDEPENSLNPELVPTLVDILLELSQNGVQIFIATHDYNLARYFDVRKNKSISVMFHNFSKGEHVTCNSSREYAKISDNHLETASADLFKAVVADAMKVQDDE